MTMTIAVLFWCLFVVFVSFLSHNTNNQMTITYNKYVNNNADNNDNNNDNNSDTNNNDDNNNDNNKVVVLFVD